MLAAAKQAITRTILTTAMDQALNAAGFAFDAVLFSDVDEMISETGKTRQQILNLCMADDEVDACRTDIHSAIIAKPWRIYDDVSGNGASGDDDGSGVPAATINRFYKAIRPLIDDFAELAILAKFNGYAVAEYVYKQEENGFWVIDKVLSKDGQLDKFSLKPDGSLNFTGINGTIAVDTKVKVLSLTSRAVPARPMGEMMILKAYPAVALRRREWAYAGQFIARYAQPFVVGKQGNMGGFGLSVADFTQRLFGFMNGGATGIGADDEISIHQLQGNGDAFEIIERLCNRRIQKLLLGRVKVSEMTQGSRAANETDDKARLDRIRSYLDLMTYAIQHAIDAMLAVNNAYGNPIHAPQGLWFEYIQELDVDVRRAERDKIYSDTGQIKFTRDYMIDMVGFEAHHFTLSDDNDDTDKAVNKDDNPNKANSPVSSFAPSPDQNPNPAKQLPAPKGANGGFNNTAPPHSHQTSPLATALPTALALSDELSDDDVDELPAPPDKLTKAAAYPMRELQTLISQYDDYDSFVVAFSQIKGAKQKANQAKDALISALANETTNAFIDGLNSKSDKE